VTLSLTTSLSSTITKSELEGNFTSIQSKFSAGIDNSDIKSGAGINISKLSASKEYTTVTLETRADGTGLNTTDQLRDIVPFPGLTGNSSSWTLKSAAWACTDVGGGTGTFEIIWAQYDADGNYAAVRTLIEEEVLTKGTDTVFNAKQCVVDNSTVDFDSALTRCFVLNVGSTDDSDALNPADVPPTPRLLKVTLLLERDIQA